MRDELTIKYLKEKYLEKFQTESEFIFSSPGRIELLGNHTDHNHGKVLVSSVNLKVLAVVGKRDDEKVVIYSKGYKKIELDLNDLTINELHAIEAIGLEGGTMTETAKKLNVTVGTLTTMVNHLVKKEYVERVSNEEDRRIVKLMLTRKGKLGYRLHDRFHYVMIKNMLEKLH